MPIAVVLQTDVDPIGIAHVISDVVHFGPGLGNDAEGPFTAVPGDIDSAVVAVDEVIGIARIDPDGVVVGMGGDEYVLECPSGVAADEGRAGVDIDHKIIIGVDGQPAVIERPEIDPIVRGFVAGPAPGRALVFGPEQAAVLGLDQNVDDIGFAAGDAQADAAIGTGREPVVDLEPGLAAVGRFIDGRAFAAAVEEIREAAVFPHSGIQDPGIRGVHGQITGAGVGIDEEDFGPGPAAVLRPIDAAARVGAP